MGGKQDKEAARTMANSQADIGKEMIDFSKGLWGESAPYRKTTGNYWSNIIKGGPELHKSVAPQINAATNQFALAKKQAENMAPGGLRDASLRDINIAKAGAKTNIYSGGIADALARLSSQANFGTQAGIGGMSGANSAFGGAAGNYMNLAQMGASSMNGLFGGLGSLVGMITVVFSIGCILIAVLRLAAAAA